MAELKQQLREIVDSNGIVERVDLARRMGWPPYECKADYLVRPGSTDEVSAVLAACHAAGQTVVTHGGRTGLAGGCTTGDGDIVLSLERMNKVEAVDVAGRTMTVGAGTVLQTAQEAAEAAGLMLALDLGGRGTATIGGNISTNAGGNQVIRYGMMREQVLGLEAVLADGTIVSSMNWVLKNNAGYDLKQLFIGSEGTLGVVTRAVLRLRPLMPATATAFVAADGFGKLTSLLGHMERALGGTLSAFEAMWQNYYLRTSAAASPPPLAADYPYYALIEANGVDEAELQARLLHALEVALESDLIANAVLAKSQAERDTFWSIRDNIPALINLAPFTAYDVSLPVAAMKDYLQEVQAGLASKLGQTEMVVFGHLGDGNLHVVVGLGNAEPRTKELSDGVVYGALASRSGSVSAEHGIGLEKKAFLHLSRSDAEIELMRRLKTTLDPKGILNPGKVV